MSERDIMALSPIYLSIDQKELYLGKRMWNRVAYEISSATLESLMGIVDDLPEMEEALIALVSGFPSVGKVTQSCGLPLSTIIETCRERIENGLSTENGYASVRIAMQDDPETHGVFINGSDEPYAASQMAIYARRIPSEPVV